MTGKLSLATGITIALATCAVALRSGRGAAECSESTVSIAAARDTSAELRLVLNVPAFRLDVVEYGAVTRSIPVAVGMRQYKTPIGSYRVDYAVWNPWWIPPDSWWARNEHREPPGWANPTGRVKLHVTGLVFLHGTPLEQTLGSAASHACVRMTNADAIALARLVHDYAGPSLPAGTLDSLESDTSRTADNDPAARIILAAGSRARPGLVTPRGLKSCQPQHTEGIHFAAPPVEFRVGVALAFELAMHVATHAAICNHFCQSTADTGPATRLPFASGLASAHSVMEHVPPGQSKSMVISLHIAVTPAVEGRTSRTVGRPPWRVPPSTPADT